MAEFVDLSPYSYLPFAEDAETPMLNVGWLGPENPYAKGLVPSEVVDGLILLADNMQHRTRGYHHCSLCDEPPPIRVSGPGLDEPVLLGSAEIHVRGQDATVYAAPTLVIHYITEHEYFPPREFQDAVLALVGRKP